MDGTRGNYLQSCCQAILKILLLTENHSRLCQIDSDFVKIMTKTRQVKREAISVPHLINGLISQQSKNHPLLFACLISSTAPGFSRADKSPASSPR